MNFLKECSRILLSFDDRIAINKIHLTPLELYVNIKDSKKLKKFSPIIYKTDLTKIFLWFIKKNMDGIKKTGRPKGSKDSKKVRQDRVTKKIVELYSKKVPITDIAKATGYSERAIHKTLDKFKELFADLKNVDAYEKNKPDLLSAAQFTILKSMVQSDKIDQATLNQAAYAFQILHNAGRLERGQATNITASYSRVVTEDVNNSRVIDVTSDDD